MSDETTVVEPKLPDAVTRTDTSPFTWTRPTIMLGASGDGTEMHLRNGASAQVVREITEEYSFDAVDETPFKIIAKSPAMFGGVRFDVLDENSTPKASEYLARVGQKVLIGFRCSQVTNLSAQFKRPVYFIYRCYITLP